MKNPAIYIDIAFCLIVLPVIAVIFPVERWFHNVPWYVLTAAAWLYGIYYLNRSVTVPFLFKRGRGKWLGIGLIVASILGTYLIASVKLYTPRFNTLDLGITRLFPGVQPYQQAVVSLFMIVEAFSFAVGLLTQVNYQRARRHAVEAERDKAEIELYKAQIKPHFMFNNLNSLYGLFLTGNEKALASLEKFISMMRYIHITSFCDLVPLSDEVGYIRQYVELQSLRLNEMTTVDMTIDVADSSLRVPPMLLVTFVENCFKHGASPVERSGITISLRESSGHLLFETKNRIFPVKRIGEHMGIDNCRKRLALLYPGRHSIEIINDGTDFAVRLEIALES